MPKTGREIVANFILLPLGLFVITLTTLPRAYACSRLAASQSASEIYRDSVALFRGVATSVELVDVSKIKSIKSEEFQIPIVRVRWRVEEIYKGKGLSHRSALTMQYFCGGILVAVGQPYIFSIVNLGFNDVRPPEFRNDIGQLNEAGMVGAWDDGEKYNSYVAEFKKLKKFN